MNDTFQEVQYIRRVWWIMLLVIGIAALMWWGFVEQIILSQPWGSNPGPNWMIWLFWLLMGIGFPLFFLLLKLVVTVQTDGIHIRYFPITSRLIAYDEIEQVTARNYNPIREYGGWGVRGIPGKSKKIAYNISGKEGVEIVLKDQRQIMIGSQKAQQLAFAIDTQRHL